MINFYDELGGEMAIRKLVHRFYQLMEVGLVALDSTLQKKVIHACECVTSLMPSVRI